jgi:hypothetical protein
MSNQHGVTRPLISQLTPSALLPVKKAHEQPEAAARDGLDGCLSER